MEFSPNLLASYTNLRWFANCGSPVRGRLDFPTIQLPSIEQAITQATSQVWADAKTEGQGDLTGYLAKTDYLSYGGNWNRLAKEAESIIRRDVMPAVEESLASLGAESLTTKVLVDLTRIALYKCYARRFHMAPDFFSRLGRVYENRKLPCGWDGDLYLWPDGALMIY